MTAEAEDKSAEASTVTDPGGSTAPEKLDPKPAPSTSSKPEAKRPGFFAHLANFWLGPAE